MGQDWIEKRFKTYSEKQQAEQLRQQQQAKALASYGSMFDGLLVSVRDAVHQYNRIFLFAAGSDCRASLEESSDGFRVEVGNKAVRVLRNPGTVAIGIKHVADGATSEEQLEVVMDKTGNLRYKYGVDDKSVSEATEIVLDRVFCQ